MTNQNWFGSSFPIPLNTCNFIVLSILTHSGRRGGTGEDGGYGGVAGGDVGGGWYVRNPLPYQMDHTSWRDLRELFLVPSWR